MALVWALELEWVSVTVSDSEMATGLGLETGSVWE
jgi:hypothetical protein